MEKVRKAGRRSSKQARRRTTIYRRIVVWSMSGGVTAAAYVFMLLATIKSGSAGAWTAFGIATTIIGLVTWHVIAEEIRAMKLEDFQG